VYLTFVIGSEPRTNDMPVLGKGYKRKPVYFTFVTERELLAARWDLVGKERIEKKRVLDFCNDAPKIRIGKTEGRGSRK
jgi:hypothetical protein